MNYALSAIPNDPGWVKFASSRTIAIEKYAMLELHLNKLFATLLKVEPKAAGVIFFKINNARSRTQIIDKLLQQNHGDQYSLYWNSLSKQIQSIDNMRNKIVHWITVNAPTPQGDYGEIWLAPPNYWESSEEKLHLSVLYRFIDECNYILKAVYTLYLVLDAKENNAVTNGELCLQALDFPPRRVIPFIIPINKVVLVCLNGFLSVFS
jgi:hypothetical protein